MAWTNQYSDEFYQPADLIDDDQDTPAPPVETLHVVNGIVSWSSFPDDVDD